MKKTLAVLIGAATLVVAAAPAQAATRELTDRHRATPARADITALKVTNGPKRVVGVVHLRKAVRGKTTMGLIIRTKNGKSYGAWTSARGGKQKKMLVAFRGADFERVRCPGLRIRIDQKRDLVRYRVPHRCLDEPRRALRVAALSERKDNGSDVEMTRWLKVKRG